MNVRCRSVSCEISSQMRLDARVSVELSKFVTTHIRHKHGIRHLIILSHTSALSWLCSASGLPSKVAKWSAWKIHAMFADDGDDDVEASYFIVPVQVTSLLFCVQKRKCARLYHPTTLHNNVVDAR